MTALTYRRITDLAAAGVIPPEAVPGLERVAAQYAVSLTPDLVALIDPADPNDPIARQFLPDPRELSATPEELADPIGDDAHSPVPGIVHRYPDRVLLKPLLTCPVYCRFCFRRESVGPGKRVLNDAQLDAALDYIRARPAIWEVILTGGDPMRMAPRRIGDLLRRVAAIPHVKVLRLHSRVPVVDPGRVTAELVAALKSADKTLYVMLHTNHPRELTAAARAACARLVDAGIPMLAQSVLLAGVNDDAAVLEALFRALVEIRVKPHYLHHADRARGTAHFRTPLRQGQDLMRDLRGRLSGLAQPTYVLDIPGGHGKVPVGPVYLAADDAGPDASGWVVTDPQGGRHRY